MVRIYVLGGGGSGKTTLARRLGARLACPVYHLDDVLFPRGWHTLSQAERQAMREAEIRRLAALPSWILEGCYPGWIEEFAAAADLIVWLDVPFWRAAWRIVKRHVLADLRRNNRHPGYRNLWRFLQGQRRYHTRSEAEYRRRLDEAAGERWGDALHCRRHVAVQFSRLGHKMLRVTGGGPAQITRRVEARLEDVRGAPQPWRG
ncbi:MAG TPA: hypothetical protein VHN78_06960 [Chloroflexota bacterium]|nr:hypothetical protein [Chloroflexota bacterium]